MASDLNGVQAKDRPSKIAKLDFGEATKENVDPSSPSTVMISPQQKERILQSQTKAKILKTSKCLNGLLTPENFGSTWFTALEAEFTKPYFTKLASYVSSERSSKTIYPPPDNVFTFTTACRIQQIKVVVVGQDPYHGPKQAHGLSFSVAKGVLPPPSLKNIFKELTNDIPHFERPDHGDLTSWAEQGVLLLNAVLTVQGHNANSHKDRGWEQFTDAIIKYFNKQHNIVFMLWGSYAQKKGACVDKSRHHVLKGVHPSPLSAHRGFFGCKHFSKANEYLIAQGKKPIDWSAL